MMIDEDADKNQFSGQVKHVQSVMLGRRNYHYLMAGLVLDEQWDSQVTIVINITNSTLVSGGRIWSDKHDWSPDCPVQLSISKRCLPKVKHFV